MNYLIDFLKKRITDKMPTEDIVKVFEQMCDMPIEDGMILFETGTFTSHSKEPLFQISLVKQCSNEDEEFYQIHVDILYEPDNENKLFSESTWDEDISESIFDYIKESRSFAYAKNKDYIKIEIYLDET